MTIVFDEVTGSVEPRDTAGARDAGQPPPEQAGERTAPDDAALDRWLRRKAWLEARRLAD